MAINSRRISALSELNTLSGDEYLVVAYNNRSYKIKTSLFTSNMISNITQEVVEGDDAVSPIIITTNDGASYRFQVKNGSQGSEGKQGKKGEQGQQGDGGVLFVANTLEDLDELILDNLDGVDKNGEKLSDEELTTKVLNALQGSILNGKLDKLREEYLTQDEYDEKLNAVPSEIEPDVKYFIIEEE